MSGGGYGGQSGNSYGNSFGNSYGNGYGGNRRMGSNPYGGSPMGRYGGGSMMGGYDGGSMIGGPVGYGQQDQPFGRFNGGGQTQYGMPNSQRVMDQNYGGSPMAGSWSGGDNQQRDDWLRGHFGNGGGLNPKPMQMDSMNQGRQLPGGGPNLENAPRMPRVLPGGGPNIERALPPQRYIVPRVLPGGGPNVETAPQPQPTGPGIFNGNPWLYRQGPTAGMSGNVPPIPPGIIPPWAFNGGNPWQTTTSDMGGQQYRPDVFSI